MQKVGIGGPSRAEWPPEAAVAESRGLFAPSFVQKVLRENESGATDHTYLIYALLSLEIWQQTFIDRPGEEITF